MNFPNFDFRPAKKWAIFKPASPTGKTHQKCVFDHFWTKNNVSDCVFPENRRALKMAIFLVLFRAFPAAIAGNLRKLYTSQRLTPKRGQNPPKIPSTLFESLGFNQTSAWVQDPSKTPQCRGVLENSSTLWGFRGKSPKILKTTCGSLNFAGPRPTKGHVVTQAEGRNTLHDHSTCSFWARRAH